MTTARLVIQDALESVNLYQPGEQARPADISRAWEVLNDMIGSWSNESLTTYATLEQSLTFVPGVYQYTIGTGATLDTTRPLRLRDGYGAAYILDPNGQRYSLEVIQQDRWNLIGNITRVNANVPEYLWYDPQMPWGILNFFPIPNIAWQAFFDSYLQLAKFPDLDSELTFPEGYDLAIKRNLALHIKPYYPNAVVSPELRESAVMAKGNIKRTNFRPTIAIYDAGIGSRGKGSYNIYRDGNV